MPRVMPTLCWMLALCAGGCTSDTRPASSLPGFQDWTETPAEADPLAEHRPSGGIWCTGVWIEDAHLEVITTQCNYASRSTALGAPLEARTTLRGALTHEALAAPNEETVTAHAAIALGSDVLWDHTFALPAEGTRVDFEVALRSRYEIGELLTVHLHNHGLNHYTWSPLEVIPP